VNLKAKQVAENSVSDLFYIEEREKRRQKIFPQDCRKAFEMAGRLAMSN
jgi:hypothetical protein